MKAMAIDYGDARTGIAISDATGLITGFTMTIHSRNENVTAFEINRLVQENTVGELVLGYPRNMDGSESLRSEKYLRFKDLVTNTTKLVPVLWDERRSSIEAHEILSASGKKTIHHKKNVDEVAASLILEGYLKLKRSRS